MNFDQFVRGTFDIVSPSPPNMEGTRPLSTPDRRPCYLMHSNLNIKIPFSAEFDEEKSMPFRHLLGFSSLADNGINGTNGTCTERGINSFPTLFTNEQRLNGAIIINFIVAFYMCGVIGYNCEKYFVTALEVICEGKLGDGQQKHTRYFKECI